MTIITFPRIFKSSVTERKHPAIFPSSILFLLDLSANKAPSFPPLFLSFFFPYSYPTNPITIAIQSIYLGPFTFQLPQSSCNSNSDKTAKTYLNDIASSTDAICRKPNLIPIKFFHCCDKYENETIFSFSFQKNYL